LKVDIEEPSNEHAGGGRPACAKPLRRRQGRPLADFFKILIK
jgi:hypothetical protein